MDSFEIRIYFSASSTVFPLLLNASFFLSIHKVTLHSSFFSPLFISRVNGHVLRLEHSTFPIVMYKERERERNSSERDSGEKLSYRPTVCLSACLSLFLSLYISYLELSTSYFIRPLFFSHLPPLFAYLSLSFFLSLCVCLQCSM